MGVQLLQSGLHAAGTGESLAWIPLPRGLVGKLLARAHCHDTAFSPQTFLIQFTSSVYHWIGLTDHGTEGHWRWTDGTAFDRARSRA